METKFVPEMAFAILAGVGIAVPSLTLAEDSPRLLSWAYAGEAFEDPANWTWTSSSSEPILSGPGAADRVFFGKTAVDKTVRFNVDAVVSNFIVEAAADGGTTFDLASHTLTVSNNMSLKCEGTLQTSDGTPLGIPQLTFRDGTINVVGTAKGGELNGQPLESAGGFFLNRLYDSYAGINVCFERVALEVASSPNMSRVRLQKGYGKTSRIHLKDGASWVLPSFNVVNDVSEPLEICVEDSTFKATGVVSIGGNGACRWLFTEGATLQVGGVYSRARTAGGRLSFVFDGGQHTLGYIEDYGDNGSCSLSYTDVVVSNGAAVVAKSVLSIRSSSTIAVCDGASLSTP